MRSASAPPASGPPSSHVWKASARWRDGFAGVRSHRDEVSYRQKTMSSMTEIRPDARELERYVLGLLPEADTERLDELSIVDDEVASRLRVVEDELVDAYVSGELEGATKARFESFYLLTERRRQKVKFARSLRVSPKPSLVRRLVPVSKVIWTLGIAATVLVAASGALVSQNLRLRSDLGEAQRAGGQLLIRTQELERRL